MSRIEEFESLISRRVVTLEGEITDKVADQVLAQMFFLQMESGHEPLHLHINSVGGSVCAGLAIFDAIEQLDCPVHTHCSGTACGMAAIILACGERNYRSAVADGHLSLGMPFAEEPGSAAMRSELPRVARILVELTVRITGLNEAKVNQLSEEAESLTPQQALDVGLIDRIERQ